MFTSPFERLNERLQFHLARLTAGQVELKRKRRRLHASVERHAETPQNFQMKLS